MDQNVHRTLNGILAISYKLNLSSSTYDESLGEYGQYEGRATLSLALVFNALTFSPGFFPPSAALRTVLKTHIQELDWFLPA
ncbi:Alstrom syndrome protein 1 [Manis javanica]|nr:Alstrom syndrome protein 1 [Manis javanica]